MGSNSTVVLFFVALMCCSRAQRLIQRGKIESSATSVISNPEVQISNGPIKGVEYQSNWTSQTIYAFKGIPFAKPPTGSLRFLPPEAPDNWTQTLDCTSYSESCLQSSGGSEDCLYINVFSPQINVTGALWPVMVYIYGGAYMEGSASDGEPDWFIAQGVVMVTFNYRVGPLGFLTLGTTTTPGNQAFKDQVLALKWVQSEISNFGGDPNLVTVFGVSAGAQSVHLHYLSPLSKGLFHRCISESGTSLVNAVRDDGATYGLALAEAMGCTGDNLTEVESCLRTVDATSLTNTGNNMSTPIEENTRAETLVWRGEIDVNTTSEPFLPAWPLELYKQGKGSFVPFIMGTNRDEGSLRLDTGATNETVANLTNNLEYLIPPSVRARNTASEVTAMADEVYQFYMNSTQPSFSNLRGYVNLYTDLYFAYGTSVSARLFRERNEVYIYLFTYDGSFGQDAVYTDEATYNLSLVEHGEERGYMWIISDVNYTTTVTSDDMKTSRRLVRMWTNFAKYGTPTVSVEPLPDLEGISWTPIDSNTTRYMHIDINLTMNESNYLGSHAVLWDSIMKSSSTSAAAPFSTPYPHVTCLLTALTTLFWLLR